METKSVVREYIESFAIAVLIVTFITVFVGRFCRVDGRSMEPTLRTGQWLWTDKIAYAFHPPQRGDIVVLKYRDTRDKYVKRVIGLPGEMIEVKDHEVYIDGARLTEPYLTAPPEYSYQETVIPEGSYFVLGDNRNNSDDSHVSVGFVPLEKIQGRAIVRLWPFWLFRIFFRPKIEKIYEYTNPYDAAIGANSAELPSFSYNNGLFASEEDGGLTVGED